VASAHADAGHAQLILMHCAPFDCMHTQPPVVVSASDGGMPRTPRGPSSARRPDTNWSTIPLFAHFRAANFTSKDLALMDETLRSVTMQGTLCVRFARVQLSIHTASHCCLRLRSRTHALSLARSLAHIRTCLLDPISFLRLLVLVLCCTFFGAHERFSIVDHAGVTVVHTMWLCMQE
jgi:hypothetical protein